MALKKASKSIQSNLFRKRILRISKKESGSI